MKILSVCCFRHWRHGLGQLRSAMAATSVSSPAPTSTTSSATPATSATGPVADARAAALTMFFSPTPGDWLPCSAQTPTTNRAKMFGDCPFSAAVRARLADLASRNYFYSGPGGHCGGDYIIGSVNGLSAVPEVLSAVGNSNGTVTVVIQRVPSVPNLTAFMTNGNGKWLATDLAVGTGPSASILSATPNC